MKSPSLIKLIYLILSYHRGFMIPPYPPTGQARSAVRSLESLGAFWGPLKVHTVTHFCSCRPLWDHMGPPCGHRDHPSSSKAPPKEPKRSKEALGSPSRPQEAKTSPSPGNPRKASGDQNEPPGETPAEAQEAKTNVQISCYHQVILSRCCCIQKVKLEYGPKKCQKAGCEP